MEKLKSAFSPTLVVALFLLIYLGLILAREGGDPLAFARLGDGFQGGQPIGEQGYDGQFAYYIALDPRPADVASQLDVPAYRYQRILYPLVARALALGQPGAIPWTLVLVNGLSQVVGTFLVERWLVGYGLSRWYALAYGLWAGLLLAVRLDLNEPLCYALAAGSILTQQRGHAWRSALCLGLAAFAKETALLFLAAQIVWAVLSRNMRFLLPSAFCLLPFALFQFLLYRWFGTFGLTSGGYLATPFEVIPFMGLWRIGAVSPAALALFAAIFGPLVVLPAVWGIVTALRRLWVRDFSPAVWALAANAGLIPFIPFSTFREPLGLVRLAAGLVLATLWYGAHARSRRVLNYSLFWLAALAFLRE
ncbi:MAG: AZOBR_p60025 family cell surface glycopolymer formation protein [Anaerolineales bacterium]